MEEIAPNAFVHMNLHGQISHTKMDQITIMQSVPIKVLATVPQESVFVMRDMKEKDVADNHVLTVAQDMVPAK